MKEEMRILFFKNVGNHLDGEDLKYIAVQKADNTYEISETPPVLNGFFSSISNYLCYDFDELSIYNQQRYEKYYLQLKRINDNIYSVQTKTYQIKRQSLT